MPGSAAEATAVRRLLGLYEEAEIELTRLVDNRLEKGITYAGWNERKLLEVRALREELQTELRRLEDRVSATVTSSLDQVYRDAARRVERELGAGVVGPVAPRRAVMALEHSLTSGLTGTHFAILRQQEDLYRSVVAEAAERGATGVMTRDQMRRRMVDQFYERGVTGFTDRRGRRWSLRSYTEMASRTAMAQAHLQGTVDRLAAHGIRLAKISRANDPCELCRPWEGKVLIVSGPRDGEHSTLDDAKAAGLYHPRCTHGMGAYIPELQEARRRQAPAAEEPAWAARGEPPPMIPMGEARELGGGINHTYRYTDTAGKEWVVKSLPGGDVNDAIPELATHAINQRVKLADIPQSWVRPGDNGDMMTVTEWREGKTLLDLGDELDDEAYTLWQGRVWDETGGDMGVLDYIVRNPDRHPGQVVINQSTGRLSAIDHDQAFTTTKGIQIEHGELSDAGRERVKATLDDFDELEAELTRIGLSEDDIMETRRRMELVSGGWS